MLRFHVLYFFYIFFIRGWALVQQQGFSIATWRLGVQAVETTWRLGVQAVKTTSLLAGVRLHTSNLPQTLQLREPCALGTNINVAYINVGFYDTGSPL